MTDRLFSEFLFAGMTVKNRFVQTPVQSRAADDQGFVTPELEAWYEARSGEAPGVIVMQQAYALPEIALRRGLGIWDDKFIDPLHHVVDKLHEGGSRVFLQLGGAGSRQNGTGLAPSPVASSSGGAVPRAMTKEEIASFRKAFTEAGVRVFKAAFDGFSLQGTGGKFLAQFLSPYSNRRTDEYGGSPRARVRIFLEIIDAIRQRTSTRFPVIMRYDCGDFMEGGLSFDMAMEQAALLIEGGVDALLMGGGGQERLQYGVPSWLIPPLPFMEMSRKYKKAFPDTPIILGGKVRSLECARRILDEGAADMVAVMRSFLADPDFLSELRQGNEKDIRHCVGCLNCQSWDRRPYLAHRPILCTVNPELFSEGRKKEPVRQGRRVMVIGGGPAGLSTALYAAQRRHQVTLFEKNAELGGQWRIAAHPEGHEDYRTLIPELERDLRKAGVTIHTGTEVSREVVERIQPDIVVVATGAGPRNLPDRLILPGAVPRIQGIDVLSGTVPEGKNIVVVGGRYIGMECACLLAAGGKKVSLVEMNDVGHGTNGRIRSEFFRRMVDLDIRIFARSEVFRVTSSTVEVVHGGSIFPLPADAVVTAVGTVPDTAVAESLQNGPWQLQLVGDCAGIGDAMDAMYAGFLLGTSIE